jgi:hypothetical protein
MEATNPILELDPRLIDGTRSFSDFPKFPLETLKSPAEELPEEVQKTRKEVRTIPRLHFTLKTLLWSLSTSYYIILVMFCGYSFS